MGLEIKICLDCGQKKSIGSTKRRCKACRRANPQWQPPSDAPPKPKKKKKRNKQQSNNGYSDYLKQPLWTEEVRPRILTRDSHKCQVCGCDKNLQVHHRSYAKAVMSGNDDSQLITLCRKHHIEIEFTKFVKNNSSANQRRPKSEIDSCLQKLLKKAYENPNFLP